MSTSGDLLERPGLPLSSMPGVEAIPVHPDVQVLESNRAHGNTDPRFSDLASVLVSRTTLAAATDSDRFVAMVPQTSDHYEDLDAGPIAAAADGYRQWPEHLQPVEAVIYDPSDPPKMIDLPADGLITAQPRNLLMLNTADCAATVLYDPRQRVLALAHIGREGAILGVGQKIVNHLQHVYQTAPADLVVHFGSSIAPESYVLPYLNEALSQEAWRPYLREIKGGYETDIVGYAIQSLLEIGIQADQVSRSPVDVATHPDYFSFTEHKQGGAPDGRNGFAAVIR